MGSYPFSFYHSYLYRGLHREPLKLSPAGRWQRQVFESESRPSPIGVCVTV